MKDHDKAFLIAGVVAGAVAGLAAAGAAGALMAQKEGRKKMEGRPLGEGEQEDQQAWEALFGGDEDAVQEVPRRSPSGDAYFAGGGLASLAGAAYLVRDCGFTGERIHIYERLPVLGGSNDGAGDGTHGFVIRGGRMLNEETYENFWELFSSIPSLENPDRSVTEEILNFDRAHPTYARARLVGRDGKILAVTGMGFNREDRFALARLLMAPEQSLDGLSIQDWFRETPHFFSTNFWRLWQTTFAFQKWSSLFEFRRYLLRMIFEFGRIETLEGVTRTPYNQYESIILPLKRYLEERGVEFVLGTTVTDVDFAPGDALTATALHLRDSQGFERVQALAAGDLCFVTNGCMTDNATLGDYRTPAPAPEGRPASGELWARLAEKRPGLGDPEPFFCHEHETGWLSFTVTCKGNRLLKKIESFSGNVPGSGALMTFCDSNWLMSIVVAAQPHFKDQPMDTTVFWGYGLYADKYGDYVKKTMNECTGEEILTELAHHLHLEQELEELKSDIVDVVPCRMPYIDAQFQPHKLADRPPVPPENSVNFAMIGQFVEIPADMVFTEEYSVRSARLAAYALTGARLPVCPVSAYYKNPAVLLRALKKFCQ